MTKWTEEQQQAIDKNGQNIIVSAGAGSGKTAVLTERVIETLKRGMSINNLLILTFTNKAAYEMKDRIRDAISKEEKVKKELDYIDSSYISTFDSFSLSIVKKYSYLLNIGKNIDIADSSIIYLEKKKIIDNIFEDMYKKKNKEFLKLINDFTIKKDDDIKKYILSISDSLDLKYDKNDFLNSYVDNYYSNSNIDLLIDNYTELLKNKIKELDNLLSEFSNMVDTDYFVEFKSLFDNLLSSSNYYDIKNNISIKLPTIPKNSSDEAKDTKKIISSYIDELENLTRYDKDELKEILMSTKEYVIAIIEVIKELDQKLLTIKQEMNMYDFSDISKMGIRILKENENVREELKNHFYEIMIDEYQDTSDLQEEFISLIANNNVYVVGDIKQSIYGFRNANPYLFKNKYDNYSKNNGGLKIDLTKNFRSREEVVKDINVLFSHLMTDLNGGADYVKTHQMISGNKTYLESGKTDQNNNLEIINYEFDPSKGFTKEEIEIFYIAKDIKEKVENKYQIFDKKKEKLRDVNFGDFTIILDRNSSFTLYKKIFQYLSIPLTINTASNIVLEDEIVLIKNILKLLINNKDKNYDVEFNYAFLSIARSYLFEIPDEEIFDMITNKKYSSDLMNIIDSITDCIDSLSLNDIIYEIVDKFNFYSKFILVGDINSRINRITSIIRIFDNLSKINYSIYDAYEYFDELITDQYKIEVKVQDSVSNSVKIMNIHMSKGLEFPICYYAGLHKGFNKEDLKDRFVYSKKYGIITPYFKEGIGSTFVKELVKYDYTHEDISERIRLFYVALTRAREKMILVTSIPDKTITNINKTSSFLDFLIYSKDVINKYIKNINIDDLNISRDYNFIKQSNYSNLIDKSNEKLNINELTIDNESLLVERISKETHSLLNKEIKEKLEFGTKMHEILELIDFKNPSYDDLDINDYFKDKIKSFISQIDIEDVINTYKEYEFLYEDNNNVYHGIIDLILEYKDKIKIIDYKLKNTDDENYIKQLNSYKNYLSLKSNKKIEIYLFSIVDGTFNEIKENM